MEYVLPEGTLAEGLPDLILPHFLDHGDENAWEVSVSEWCEAFQQSNFGFN